MADHLEAASTLGLFSLASVGCVAALTGEIVPTVATAGLVLLGLGGGLWFHFASARSTDDPREQLHFEDPIPDVTNRQLALGWVVIGAAGAAGARDVALLLVGVTIGASTLLVTDSRPSTDE